MSKKSNNKIKTVNNADGFDINNLITGYHFRVDFCVDNKYIKDIGFKKVSGLDYKQEFKQTDIGASKKGDQANLILKSTFSDLVLERAMNVDSRLYYWLTDQRDKKEKIKIPIVVTVLNHDHLPIFSWFFINAYPISWETTGFEAETNAFLMEKITFRYEFFRRVDMSKSKTIADIKTNRFARN